MKGSGTSQDLNVDNGTWYLLLTSVKDYWPRCVSVSTYRNEMTQLPNPSSTHIIQPTPCISFLFRPVPSFSINFSQIQNYFELSSAWNSFHFKMWAAVIFLNIVCPPMESMGKVLSGNLNSRNKNARCASLLNWWLVAESWKEEYCRPTAAGILFSRM